MGHVVGRKLPHGIVKEATQVRVALLLSIEHVLDVAFAVAEIVDDFFEIA